MIVDEAAITRHATAREFLTREARTLDDGEFQEWVADFLAEEVTYRVPTRTTQERETRSEFGRESYHFNETRDSLETRVNRLENEYAWSANPPSRIRRVVSNIAVDPSGDGGLTVTDYLVVLRYDRDDRRAQLLSAERVSELQVDEQSVRLSNRDVFLDQTAIGFDHLPLL